MYKLIFLPVGLVFLYILRRIFNGPKLKIIRKVIGQVVIITGASYGIGKQTALHLLGSGATVVFANRNKEETLKVIKSLPLQEQERAIFLELDLSNSRSILNFVDSVRKTFNRIDILINNAAASIPYFRLSADRLEYTIQVNYFGPVYMTLLLLGMLDRDSRIINVASHVYSFGSRRGIENFLEDTDFSRTSRSYWTSYQYIYAKLGIIYFTRILANYLEDKEIKVVALCPGAVQTNFVSNLDNWYWKLIKIALYPFYRLYYKDEKTGAATTLTLCYLNNKEILNGAFYEDTKVQKYHKVAFDSSLLSAYVSYTKLILQTLFPGHSAVSSFLKFSESQFVDKSNFALK